MITENMQTSDSGCISIKLCLKKEVIGQIRPAGHRGRIYINNKSAKNNIRNSDGKKKKKIVIQAWKPLEKVRKRSEAQKLIYER